MTWVHIDDRMPESGQHVLFVWRNLLGNSRISSGHWIKAKTTEAGDSSVEFDCAEYDEETDTYYEKEGWYEWGWELEYLAEPQGPVTHWMPMPEWPV